MHLVLDQDPKLNGAVCHPGQGEVCEQEGYYINSVSFLWLNTSYSSSLCGAAPVLSSAFYSRLPASFVSVINVTEAILGSANANYLWFKLHANTHN